MEVGSQFFNKNVPLARKEKYFVWTFFSLNLLTFISLDSQILDLPSIIDYVIIVSLLTVFIFQSVRNFARQKYSRRLDRFVIYLFSFYSVYLVIGSVQFEQFYLQKSLKGIFYLLPYLLPPILLAVNVRREMLIYGMQLSLKLLPFALLSVIYVFFNLEVTLSDYHYYLLTIFSSWLVLAFISQYNLIRRQKLLLVIYFISVLSIAAIYGRRTWFAIEALGIASMIYLSWSRINNIGIKLFYMTFLMVTILFSIAMFSNSLKSLYVFQRGIDQVSFIQSRGGVLERFINDFDENGGWIFGRGLNGEVERKIASIERGALIEHGYYARILKGGFIYLSLFVLIAVRSIYIVLFKRYDVISKAVAAIIVIYLIGMIGFNVPVFHTTHLSIYLFAAYALRNRNIIS